MIDLKTLKLNGYNYSDKNIDLKSEVYVSEKTEDDWIELATDFDNENNIILMIFENCSMIKVTVFDANQFDQELIEESINRYI